MTEPFKVGDVVQLKSGGLKMTVVGTSTDPRGEPLVSCAWFAKEKKGQDCFPANALAKVLGDTLQEFLEQLPDDGDG